MGWVYIVVIFLCVLMFNQAKREQLYDRLENIDFDVADLHYLHRYFDHDGNIGTHMTTRVTDMERILYTLLFDLELDPNQTKVLDLGSGFGFPVAAFAAVGFQAYGVDKGDKEVYTAARRIRELPRKLGRPIKHQPRFMIANYEHENFPHKRFPDGTRLEDIDVFYCNWYGEASTYVHELRVLSKLSRAKPGAIVIPASSYAINTQPALVYFEVLRTETHTCARRKQPV